ncbi:NADH dehydrogenase [ubiquinone] 1 alpha subcomplex assembly factor 4 [Elgaria multicarinata webbii]|uniref:NADH dehydrogenase [ubiquinone] 1 alpha subcomplex assembly factor 4 n=1 Tax=Elgaria multicarinata webbii TaxID=159646 RepID=UPI002FCD5394
MMGARVTRALSKFNLENRAHREIAKAKPRPAPRYPTAAARDDLTRLQKEIKKKDNHLHTLLKEVYVDSRDPAMHVNKRESLPSKQEERRLTKVGGLGQLDIQTIPKGKISIVEVLTLLSNHHQSPQTWTAEKIAEEYSLDLKDVTALLKFFIPFAVEIFPHVDKKALKPS